MPAQHGPAAQRGPAAVEHACPHIGQLVAARPRPIPPGMEPGEHILNDVFGGRPVPDQHHRQPDKFRVVLAEERGDIHRWAGRGRLTCHLGPASAAVTIAALTAKRIAHINGTLLGRVWLPGRFHLTHRAA